MLDNEDFFFAFTGVVTHPTSLKDLSELTSLSGFHRWVYSEEALSLLMLCMPAYTLWLKHSDSKLQ